MIQVPGRFNKSDWSPMLQSNDWSFSANTSFINAPHTTGYWNGALVWGQEPVAAASGLKASSLVAYPNPSAGAGTNLSLTLTGPGGGPLTDPNAQVSLKVFTQSQRLIWSETLPASVFGSSGEHVHFWDERDLSGAHLSNGLYTVVATVSSQGSSTRVFSRVLILK
jgi:hypothetical protein